jgi:hypothetical protein
MAVELCTSIQTVRKYFHIGQCTIEGWPTGFSRTVLTDSRLAYVGGNCRYFDVTSFQTLICYNN